MIIKPVCPKCLKIAFEYYVGDTINLEKRDLKFPEPIACEHCGHRMKKIEKGSGTLKRIK